MSPGKSMKADEAKWRAEDDARTLIRAREILRDSKRLAAAKAQVLAQQQDAKAALEMIKDG